MSGAVLDPADLVTRFGGSARAALATVAGGTGFFAVTPQAPYDETLSTADQARQLFSKAEARLNEIGAHKGSMLFAAIMLRDIADVAEFNAVWDEWVSETTPPARACFEARLANPALKVELIIVAACRSKDD